MSSPLFSPNQTLKSMIKLLFSDFRSTMSSFSLISSGRIRSLFIFVLWNHIRQLNTHKKSPPMIYAWIGPSPAFFEAYSQQLETTVFCPLEYLPLFFIPSICSPVALCCNLQKDNNQTTFRIKQFQLTKHLLYLRIHPHSIFMGPCRGENREMSVLDRHYFLVSCKSQNPLT